MDHVRTLQRRRCIEESKRHSGRVHRISNGTTVPVFPEQSYIALPVERVATFVIGMLIRRSTHFNFSVSTRKL